MSSYPPIQTKTCKVCKQTKQDKFFYVGRRVCQDCYRDRQTEYYNRNQDILRKKSLERYYRITGK